MLTRQMHHLIARFQQEVEQVIPLGYVLSGFEDIQAEGRDLVIQFTADLRDGIDPSVALRIARLDLNRIKGHVRNGRIH